MDEAKLLREQLQELWVLVNKMKLSPNFALYEFTRSQTATRRGIRNVPLASQIESMRKLSVNVLQPVREHFGRAVNINSGFRCQELNEAIGGSSTSQHMKGEAADIEIFGVSNLDLAIWIRDHLDFDQLILEFWDASQGPNSGWVHVSYASEKQNRKQVLRAWRHGKKTQYDKGLPEPVKA